MNANLAKLKADVADVKANYLEIKSKLDLLLQIFNQKEDKKEDHGASSASSQGFISQG